MSEYFIKRGDRVHGFTREQIMGFAKAKKITGSDLVGNSPKALSKSSKQFGNRSKIQAQLQRTLDQLVLCLM